MRSFISGGLGQPFAGVTLLAFDHAGDGFHAIPGAPLAGGVLLLRRLGLFFQGDEFLHEASINQMSLVKRRLTLAQVTSGMMRMESGIRSRSSFGIPIEAIQTCPSWTSGGRNAPF